MIIIFSVKSGIMNSSNEALGWNGQGQGAPQDEARYHMK